MNFLESLDLSSGRRKTLFVGVSILLLPFLLNAVLVFTPLMLPFPDELECDQRLPGDKFIYSFDGGKFVPEVQGIRNDVFVPVGGHGFKDRDKINLKPCSTESNTAFAESVIRSNLGLPRKNVSTSE